MKNRGFTLLELLISITIIGLLAAIVIVYISSARDKSNDVKVRAQLSRARASAELFFNTNNSYNGSFGNVAFDCNTPNSMFTNVTSGMVNYTTAANYPNNTLLRCSSNGTSYAISASLTINSGGPNPDFWCVDSQNDSKIIEGASHSAAHPNNDTDC